MKINRIRLQCEEDSTKTAIFIATGKTLLGIIGSGKTLLGITDNMGKYQY